VKTRSVVVQEGPGGESLGRLDSAVGPQRSDGLEVEGELAAAAGGLGLGDLGVVGDHDHGLADGQPAGVQVQVGPAHSQDFAAAHTGEGGQPPGGI
jgi:hypothetical protein